MTKTSHIWFAILSLSFVWLLSGVTSLFWGWQTGLDILANAGVVGPAAHLSIYLGASIDILFGIWVPLAFCVASSRQWRLLCHAQISLVFIYSFIITIVAPEFWLHPFGPLSKNLPIIALLLLLKPLKNLQKSTL